MSPNKARNKLMQLRVAVEYCASTVENDTMNMKAKDNNKMKKTTAKPATIFALFVNVFVTSANVGDSSKYAINCEHKRN